MAVFTTEVAQQVVDMANRIMDLARRGDKQAFKDARWFCKHIIKQIDDWEASSFEKDLNGYEWDFKHDDPADACRHLVYIVQESTKKILQKMQAHNDKWNF